MEEDGENQLDSEKDKCTSTGTSRRRKNITQDNK